MFTLHIIQIGKIKKHMSTHILIQKVLVLKSEKENVHIFYCFCESSIYF